MKSRLIELLDVSMFSAAAVKRRSGHWSSATGESNLLYERLFPDATLPFAASTGLRSQFTMFMLTERSRECSSTLY